MSETLSPAAMAAVTSASAHKVAMAPKAVRHFGLAAMAARAERSRAVAEPPPPLAPVIPRPRRVRVRLWLPLTALFLLLAPFALLLTPLIWLCTPPRYRTPPLATVIGLGRLLLSLGGTVVHVDTPDALVIIRIF